MERELSREYGLAFVDFQTTDSTELRVAFPSSPFADGPDVARRGTARKVGEYVRDHYPRYKALNKVTVEFLTKKETVADTLKHVAASYTFSRAALGPPPGVAAPPADSGVPPGG
ncbi:MAG TPA: hypothetical protein VGO40_23185 [Longimicrobium sp.]|nr:hypothetical protein [Longimicrobium sp.]